jgi:pilus assembly protein CpaC
MLLAAVLLLICSMTPLLATPQVKQLQAGRSELLDFQGIERLALSDPAVFDYVVLSKKQIMIVAKKTGEGDLFVWDTDGRHTFHVIVSPPISRIPEIVEQIKKAIDRPAISVSEYNEVVLLEGEVSTADEAKRAETIAKAYTGKVENLVRVTGVPVVDETITAGPPVAKTLPVGGTETLDFHGIVRITSSEAAVADTVELSKIQLLLVGKKPGETSLVVWDKLGPHPFHLTITSRIAEIAMQIKQAIDRPAISVRDVNDTVVLEGDVSSPDEIKRAETIARAYTANVSNLLRFRGITSTHVIDLAELQRVVGTGIRIREVADGVLLLEGTATPEERARLDTMIRALGTRASVIDMVTTTTSPPRQVLVRVRAVEINRNNLNQLGIDWGGLDAAGAHDQPIVFGETNAGVHDLSDFGPIKRLEGISARLQALITQGRARVLAEPNLVVSEGEKAQILVGGEIPIPIAQSVVGSAGTVTIEWKEFGVKLDMKALISADAASINLDVAPEVSNLDYTNAVTISNFRVPALQTRKAHSVVQIRNGQTLVIGGLYQATETRVRRKIPLLGDIPLVGNLFRHTDKQTQNTDLVVFVTPQIMTDATAAAQLQNAQRVAGEVVTNVGTQPQP